MKYKRREPRSSRFHFIEEVALIVQSNGKVRRSPDEWQEIITRFTRGDQSLREFCRREKIHLTSFQRWQKRLAESKHEEFVDVTPVQDSTSPWAVEIELTSGTVLRLRG